ncbi:MAG: FmdB family transcriptional regulator [Desulfobacterales bacterium RIFOXYA12_FULL_46_15]|nr:MAG: FmdB family transcriptional regulator [Desulfobacterales bacterium RIFOXYA12_FULL_46_15]
MPVYEYQCKDCGKIEEVFQKISDPVCTTCSHCKGRLNKLISQSAFHLKGSGWYVTDYGGAKQGSETKSEIKNDTTSNESKTASAKDAD